MVTVPPPLHGLLSLANRVAGSSFAVETDDPIVVLTYDDGPDPAVTQAILGHLAEARATATFFVLLTRARPAKSTVAEILTQGHEIALHGPDHQALPQFGFRETLRRTKAARAELEDLTGHEISLFRPPYGAMTPANQAAVIAAGLEPVLWGPALGDWRDVSRAEMVADGVAGARPGAVVLAHDAIADERDGVDDGPTVPHDRPALARELLEAFAAKGLRTSSYGEARRTGSARRRIRVRIGQRVVDLGPYARGWSSS